MKTALFTLALLAQLATAQATTAPAPTQEGAFIASAPATSGGEVVATLRRGSTFRG